MAKEQKYLYAIDLVAGVKPRNFPQKMYLDYNEYLGGIHPDTLYAAKYSAEDLSRYFRPTQFSDINLVRSTLKIDDKISLFLTAGADNGLEEVLRFCRDNLRVKNYYSISRPTYDHFDVFCNKNKLNLTDFDAADLVYVCTPNNPDGKIVEPAVLANLVSTNPEKIFLVDLSYALYSDFAYQDYLNPLKNFGNFIFVSSFAKIFPIGGLRAGVIGTTNSDFCTHLSNYLNQKLVTVVARRVLSSCLTNFCFYKSQVDEIYRNRIEIATLLGEYLIQNGIDCTIGNPDQLGGNYICLKVPPNDLASTYDLFAKKGIAVRTKSTWNFLRVTSLNNEGVSELRHRLKGNLYDND